jgi:hypothetical protein
MILLFLTTHSFGYIGQEIHSIITSPIPEEPHGERVVASRVAGPPFDAAFVTVVSMLIGFVMPLLATGAGRESRGPITQQFQSRNLRQRFGASDY